jgi:hypothetical protein
MYYPLVDIPLTFTIMFPVKSKRVYRTTSSPSLNSERGQTLHTAILENKTTQAKVSLAQTDAIKSQTKAKTVFASTIARGADTSSVVRAELQAITSTLDKAMTWTGKLMKVISEAPYEAEVNATVIKREMLATQLEKLKQQLIDSLVSRFMENLQSAKEAATDTVKEIARQTNVLSQTMMPNVIETVHATNIALEEATIAVTKTAAWFHMAAEAESQSMMIAESFASSSRATHESRAKKAALDIAKEVMKSQSTAEIWRNLEDETQKTKEAWMEAAEVIKRTVKAIKQAVDQITFAFHVIIAAIDKHILHAERAKFDTIVTSMKRITRTVTPARAIITDIVAHINVCAREMERAATATRKLQSLIADIPSGEVI